MKIFSNWDVLPEGWYCLGPSNQINKEVEILNKNIGNQSVIVYRGSDGNLACLDAFCPHMGLNLKLGKVIGNEIRCSFHHWKFDKEGNLSDFPCKSNKPNASLQSYRVEELYGHIWVWPNKEPTYPLPSHFSFNEGEYSCKIGNSYERPSHPHVSLINALDLQHVNTVHALELEVSADITESEDDSYIHYDFDGKFITSSKKGKRSAFFTGGGYRYSVRYYSGTIGILKALEGIKLFSKISTPPIYGFFGYCPLPDKKTKIYPIFLTKKRRGLFGYVFSRLHLLITSIIYTNLKNEDGEIYENIRFSPTFVAEDSNVTKFVSYLNKLKPSIFSNNNS